MVADSPVDVKIDANVTANLDPIIEATPKGLRKLFSLPFARLEARNARYVALMAAQTEHDRELIYQGRAIFRDGNIVKLEHKSPAIDNILQAEQHYELNNLVENLEIAAEALKDIPDDEVSDREVDEDFFARWRREAKVIGNKDLQRLWGRLLAEEIKEPSAISFRALDVLKNITSKEARIFQSISRYITSPGIFICNISDQILPLDVDFNDLVLLHDCGLTVNVDSSLVAYANDIVLIDGITYTCVKIENIVFAMIPIKFAVTIPGVAMTSAGNVALQVCDRDKLSINAIRYICKVLARAKNNDFERIKVYEELNGESKFPNYTLIYDNFPA